jgi:hypothetical protein
MKSTLLALSLMPWLLTAALAEPVSATGDSMAGDTMPAATATETETADTAATEPAAPQPTAEADTELTEQVGFSRGRVTRATFTSGVQEREPIDNVQQTDSSAETIYYFTELRDMSGQTATHRWEHNGEVVAEINFNVNGPRWRVWSQKTLVPEFTGDWKVSVLNGAGEVIAEDVLTMSAMPAAPAVMEAEPMPQETIERLPVESTQ